MEVSQVNHHAEVDFWDFVSVVDLVMSISAAVGAWLAVFLEVVR